MKEEKRGTRDRNTKVLVLLITIISLLATAPVLAVTGIVTIDGTATDLRYTGSSTNTAQFYQDAISPNSDLGLELCGSSASTFIGAAYAFNKLGTYSSVAISYGVNSTSSLQQTTFRSGTCFVTNPVGTLTISPSHLSTRTPEVFVAAFPGRIFVQNSSTADGFNSSFHNATGSSLLGSYSFSSFYSEDSRNVTIFTPTISFTTSSGSFSKSATDSDFGVNNDRRMVVSVCTETQGVNCSDGNVVNNSNQFPMQLVTDLTPSESTTFTRNMVINGLADSICIGPDLNTNTLRVNGSSSYTTESGSIVNISIRVTNSGNVDVASSFVINVSVDNVAAATFTIPGLTNGTSATRTFVYDTSSLASGAHTVRGTVYDTAFGDCTPGNDNSSATLTLSKTYRPIVLVDDVETPNLTFAGRPYRVTIKVNDSDDLPAAGARVDLVEQNGLSIFAPLQTFNGTTGLRPSTYAVFYLNSTGQVSFTMIPTGNKLYEPAFGFANLTTAVGNYSLYFEIFDNSTGSELPMILPGQGSIDKFHFNLENLTVTSPTGAQVDSLNVNFQNTFVQQVVEFVDQAFAAAFSWLSLI